MFNETVRRVMKCAYLAGAIIAIALILRKDIGWAAAIMLGIIWSVANYSLTVHLFEIALLKKDPRRITGALVVKFPVLYLAGFFILKSGWFPIMGLLAGIGISLVIIGIVNIWPKQA